MKLISFLCLFISFSAYSKNFVPASFSANYIETLRSATGKLVESSGKIDYKYPGHIRFEVLKPEKSKTLFVVNPEKAWIYQPAFIKGEKNQVTIQKSTNLPLVKFLDSVKEGIESSKLFTTKYEKNDLTLTFVKTIQKEMGLQQVILHANTSAKEIKTLKGFENLTLKYTNGNKTNIKLIDLKENVKFPSSHFVFKPSANTKVISN